MAAITRTDADIQKDILDELKWVPDIDESNIGIHVKDGAVTLTGSVSSYPAKLAANSAIKRIKGVRAIADDINVKFSSQMDGDDADIAQRIAAIFKWNARIRGDDIKAEVRNGFVTLTGDVDWQYQKNHVASQIEGIKGIRFIFNNINIRKRATSADVQQEIVQALHRHASLEADHVNVSVLNGTVTLTGKIDSYKDKDLIESAVWAAPGVTKIIDHLQIA